MIIVSPDPKRDHMSLARIEQISPQLALDISQCVERYGTSPERWKIAPATVRKRLSYFIPAFGKLLGCVDATARIAIAGQGLDALHSESVWAEFEGAAFKLFDDRSQIGSICGALHFCAAIHFNQPDLHPPSDLVLRFGHTEVSRLYHVSASFMLTYRRLLLSIDARSRTVTTAHAVKQGTYVLLRSLIERPEVRHLLARRGFDAFSDSPELLITAASDVRERNSSKMLALLIEFDPERWARKTVELFGKVDLTALYERSPVIYDEIDRYAKLIATRSLRGRLKETVKDQLSHLKRVLLHLIEVLPLADAINVSMRGLYGFVENNAMLLSWLYEYKICPKSDVKIVRQVVDVLFPECSKSDDFFHHIVSHSETRTQKDLSTATMVLCGVFRMHCMTISSDSLRNKRRFSIIVHSMRRPSTTTSLSSRRC